MPSSPPLPVLALRLEALAIGAPSKRKATTAPFDPKRHGHYGLPNDSATPLALVALSRLAQARDESILQEVATAPAGALLVSALRAAVHRLACSADGGATSAFSDATANAFLQTAASTIAMQHRYAKAGLTLPSALPWASAKKLAVALLDSVTAVRHSAPGARLHTRLLTLPPPVMNDETRTDVAALVATVEADVATRIADGGAPPSSAASTSSGTTDPLPLPLPVPVDAAPFALDGTAGVSDNVARLVQSALRRHLDASERATLDAALEQGLGLLQEGGGAEARRQLLASSALTALTSTGVAYVWAASVDRAERGVASVDAFARDVVDGCSELAAALFSASLGF